MLTNKTKSEIVQKLLAEPEMSATAIAKFFGVDKNTVIALNRKFKVREHKSIKVTTPEVQVEMLELRKQGMSKYDIAAKLDVTPTTVRKYLQEEAEIKQIVLKPGSFVGIEINEAGEYIIKYK